MIGSDIDNEMALARKILGLVTQHETDLQRLKKRVSQWELQPIMVTGIELPLESSSFSSSESSSFSSSESSSESSSVSSSESSSESSSVSSSESASSSESSSFSSSESSSASSSASSSSESSSASSSASSSDTSSSSAESGYPCQDCDNIPGLLAVTLSNSSSACIGPTPGTYDMLYDSGDNAWVTPCFTSTGGGIWHLIWPYCHVRIKCYRDIDWGSVLGTGGSYPYATDTFLMLQIEFCGESDCSGTSTPTSDWQPLRAFGGGDVCSPFYMLGSWTNSGYCSGGGSNVVTAEVTQ